ncbi:PhzF family phenazine biosynthesis isomerase [Caulobacter sp. 1776]|uniref:PhzF family phenazine biosynthesis isomerase n=1 Tax=Caulobacter sp. 1776 TaxID=3156420 RepID=UPI003392A613
MPAYRLYQIDAFTNAPFTGNPAGVVPDARGLSEAAMQAIAREMNVSETAFVFPEAGEDHDMTVRFFTPTTEVPICGHATIASHWVRAMEGAPDGIVRQKTGAGVLPVEIDRTDGVTRIWMTQALATFDPPLPHALRDEVYSALGAPPLALADFAPISVVSTGHSKVIVPLSSVQALQDLSPDLQALARLSARIGSNGFYPFALADPGEAVRAYGRMFAPAIGIAEDPVTGNAAGPLGAYLAHHGLLALTADRPAQFKVGQGHAVGRPGTILVEVRRVAERYRVRVAGEAVAIFRTEIEVAM